MAGLQTAFEDGEYAMSRGLSGSEHVHIDPVSLRNETSATNGRVVGKESMDDCMMFRNSKDSGSGGTAAIFAQVRLWR